MIDERGLTGKINRRDFLGLAWKSVLGMCGLLGLAGLWRFFSFKPDLDSPAEFDLGPSSEYPAGSREVYPEAPALVIHDEAGIRALSLTCPHLGCTVEVVPEGFTCPCHGSQFDLQGAVVRGPAQDRLPPLEIEMTENGRLILVAR
jgi:cytochrome b6-f complex iron-sulfur subunit